MKYERMKEAIKEIEALKEEKADILRHLDNEGNGNVTGQITIGYDKGGYLHLNTTHPLFEKITDFISETFLERQTEINKKIKELENE